MNCFQNRDQHTKKKVKPQEKDILNFEAKEERLITKCTVLEEEVRKENIKLREDIAAKDIELGEAFEEKKKLEEKITSLLDVYIVWL